MNKGDKKTKPAKPKRRKKILSGDSTPLWMNLGQPSAGPSEISLICRSKSLNDMATSDLVADTMNMVLALAWRAKQKRDRDALLNLVLAAKTINRLIASLEESHTELFSFFASEQSEWPVNLVPKQQLVEVALMRLHQLKVGTASTPPTWRGVQIDSTNWATVIANELIRRLEAWRSQRATKPVSLSPLLASLNKSRLLELGEIPDKCSDLRELDTLGPKTWKTWWPYAGAALDALWKQHPELYRECLNLDSVADEMTKGSDSVRRNFIKRHIKQAFGSIAKNIRSRFLA